MDSFTCQLNKVISIYLMDLVEYNYILLDLEVKQYSQL